MLMIIFSMVTEKSYFTTILQASNNTAQTSNVVPEPPSSASANLRSVTVHSAQQGSYFQASNVMLEPSTSGSAYFRSARVHSSLDSTTELQTMKALLKDYDELMFGTWHMHQQCKLCVAALGCEYKNSNYIKHKTGSPTCPQMRTWARNRCFDCLEVHQGRCHHLQHIDECKKRKFAIGNNAVCGGCLVGDNRSQNLIPTFHTGDYKFGPSKCKIGYHGIALFICMYLFEFKRDELDKIVGSRAQYKSCFVSGDHKKNFVMFCMRLWCKGVKITNAVVIFVVYLKFFQGQDIIVQESHKQSFQNLLRMQPEMST